jgi:uncharacterized membrane protein
MFSVILLVHVAAGTVALITGPVPMLARKGGWTHRRFGTVFAAAMLTVSVAGFVMAILRWKELLLVIAVSTFFLTYNGVRAIRLRRGAPVLAVDHLVCLLAAGFSAWLLWQGLIEVDVTSLFLGVGGLYLAVRHDSRLRAPRVDWLATHLAMMGGAYIATVSAFLVVNLTELPKPLVFIGPTVLGAPLVALAAVRRRRSMAAPV